MLVAVGLLSCGICNMVYGKNSPCWSQAEEATPAEVRNHTTNTGNTTHADTTKADYTTLAGVVTPLEDTIDIDTIPVINNTTHKGTNDSDSLSDNNRQSSLSSITLSLTKSGDVSSFRRHPPAESLSSQQLTHTRSSSAPQLTTSDCLDRRGETVLPLPFIARADPIYSSDDNHCVLDDVTTPHDVTNSTSCDFVIEAPPSYEELIREGEMIPWEV